MKKTLIGLMFAASLPVWAATPPVIDGFRLGMSKSEASKLKPEAAWRPFSGSSEQKEFQSSYGGLPARIKITLDGRGLTVVSIGIIVSTKEQASCADGAKQGLAGLEKSLGKATSTASKPMPRAVWVDSAGTTTMWFNSCANQPPEYIITHSKAAP